MKTEDDCGLFFIVPRKKSDATSLETRLIKWVNNYPFPKSLYLNQDIKEIRSTLINRVIECNNNIPTAIGYYKNWIQKNQHDVTEASIRDTKLKIHCLEKFILNDRG